MAIRNVGTGQTYATLDSALTGINIGDIIVFKNKATYTMSVYTASYFNMTSDYTENPDDFPTINHTTNDYYGSFNAGAMTWEKIIIVDTAADGIYLGQSNLTHTFNRVIWKSGSGNTTIKFTSNTGTYIFKNCLFQNITKTRLILNGDYSSWVNIYFYNCTFDNIGTFMDADLGLGDGEAAKFLVQNCIFTGTWTAPGNNFRSRVTYSLTSEALTNYGTGCVSNSDPQFAASVRTSASNPSDWKILSSSPAKAIGLSTNAPTIDIGNVTRTGTWDAGIWIVNTGVTKRRILYIT